MKETRLQDDKTDFTAALRTRGCAVCNHVIKAARDFFAKWQYALAADEKAQSVFLSQERVLRQGGSVGAHRRDQRLHVTHDAMLREQRAAGGLRRIERRSGSGLRHGGCSVK